jgi:hypothetical protein
MAVTSIHLIANDGRVVETRIDGVAIFSNLAATPVEPPFRILGKVHEYRPTQLNSSDMDDLIVDLRRMKTLVPNAVEVRVLPRGREIALALMEAILIMAKECKRGGHVLYFDTE